MHFSFPHWVRGVLPSVDIYQTHPTGMITDQGKNTRFFPQKHVQYQKSVSICGAGDHWIK